MQDFTRLADAVHRNGDRVISSNVTLTHVTLHKVLQCAAQRAGVSRTLHTTCQQVPAFDQQGARIFVTIVQPTMARFVYSSLQVVPRARPLALSKCSGSTMDLCGCQPLRANRSPCRYRLTAPSRERPCSRSITVLCAFMRLPNRRRNACVRHEDSHNARRLVLNLPFNTTMAPLHGYQLFFKKQEVRAL